MMHASKELISHHIKMHQSQCEIDDPVGEFMSCGCKQKTFAVIVCMGCFEIVFNAVSSKETYGANMHLHSCNI